LRDTWQKPILLQSRVSLAFAAGDHKAGIDALTCGRAYLAKSMTRQTPRISERRRVEPLANWIVAQLSRIERGSCNIDNVQESRSVSGFVVFPVSRRYHPKK
jgi:hypothetical protein